MYKNRLHYYSAPITANIEDVDQLLSVIKSIYRPGDFVAMKLDIDNSPLETAVIDAIEADPNLLNSIGEIFYEQHYDHPGNHICTLEMQCAPIVCRFHQRIKYHCLVMISAQLSMS